MSRGDGAGTGWGSSDCSGTSAVRRGEPDRSARSGDAARWFIARPGGRLLTGAGFGALYAGVAVLALMGAEPSPSVVAASLALGAGLVALSVIDLEQLRLPDAITLPLAAGGVLCAAALHGAPFWWHFMSALAGFMSLFLLARCYRWLRGRPGMGLGDAKLFAAAGAWLGLEGLPLVLLYAAGGALTAALLAAASGRKITAGSRFAFGPFLAFATWLVWLYGPLSP